MLKNAKTRLGATIFLLAMCGVVVLAFTVLPQMFAKSAARVPLSVLVAASVAQSAVMIALAVWAGVALSKPLGLGAPAIEAALAGSGAWAALKRQLLPAALVGLCMGALLVLLGRVAPAQLQALGQAVDIPVAAKVLYGGITEEVLLRWGVMTVLVWLPWRLLRKKAGPPSSGWIAGAILAAAVLFGALHLPAALAMGAHLSAPVVAYILAGNAVPGILFGLLYWRYGIEAAMMAHALAHIVGIAAGAM
jgi:hypothetical protein